MNISAKNHDASSTCLKIACSDSFNTQLDIFQCCQPFFSNSAQVFCEIVLFGAFSTSIVLK